MRTLPPRQLEQAVDVQVQLRQELERDEHEDEEDREAQRLAVPVVDELERVPADPEEIDDHDVPHEVHHIRDREDDRQRDRLPPPRVPGAQHEARGDRVRLEGRAGEDDVHDGVVPGLDRDAE